MKSSNVEELFNSSKFIDEETRMTVRLRRKNDIVPSPWEIGNLIDNISNYYYKMELINVVSKAIENGVSPKNIFILDKSFKLNTSYKDLDVMSIIDERIENMYTIGVPYSIYPNKEIFILAMIFKTFRLCNEMLFTYKKLHIDNRKIAQYTKEYYVEQKSEEIVIKNIVKNTLLTLKDKFEFTSKEDEQHAVNRLDSIENSMLLEINEFILDEADMLNIENSLSKFKDEKDEEKILENKVYNKYYNDFFPLMNKVSRPVVCVYYSKTKQIQILSLGHIARNKRNTTFLDIKSISHNSPLLADIGMAVTNGIDTIYKTTKDESRKKEKHEVEMKILEAQLRKANAEADIAEIERLEKKIQLYTELHNLYETYGGNPAQSIKNGYLQNRMTVAYETIQKGSQKLLEENSLQIESVEVQNHIDVRI